MPYARASDLPPAVLKALPTPRLREAFLKAFNAAFAEYKDETKAFATAWSTIGKIATKQKDGTWKVNAGMEKPAKKSSPFGLLAKFFGADDGDPDPEPAGSAAESAPEPEPVGKRVPFTLAAEVKKVDDEMHVVWGWASVIEDGGKPVVDLQGDVIGEADLIEAAHGFMRDARLAKAMHEGDGIGEVVESLVFTRDLQKALGIDLGRVGWLIGMHVEDPAAWALFKNGTYTGFSIAGTALAEEIAHDETA